MIEIAWGLPNPYRALQVSLTNECFFPRKTKNLGFCGKVLPFLPSQQQGGSDKNTVMSSGYNNHGITGTAIAFMNGKKGRGNGDNHRDHSSHKPFETGCTTRDFYLRYTHLPDSVSGYRKRVVKKRIALPPRIVSKIPMF